MDTTETQKYTIPRPSIMQQSAEVEHGSPIWPLAHWGFWGRALAYTVTVPAAKIVSIARKMVLLCIEKMSNGGVDSGSTRWDDYGQALILFLYRQGIAKIGLVLDSVFKLCHPEHSSCLSTWAVQQDTLTLTTWMYCAMDLQLEI